MLALVDCGASAPVALQKRGIDPGEIEVILLTHLHGDHFGGVPFVLLDGTFNRRRRKPLTVAGPPGVEAAVMRVYDVLFPGTVDRVCERVAARFHELKPLEAASFGALEAIAYPVDHGAHVASNALRIGVDGRVVAFSSDTQWHPHLVDVSRGADVFVCECSGYRKAAPGHLSLDDLRAHAPELSARRIVLTHMGREMLEHAQEAPFDLATDGLVIEV